MEDKPDKDLNILAESDKSLPKWPLVSLRLAQEDVENVMSLTGETSPGKAVKAAVLEFLRIRQGSAVSRPPAKPKEIPQPAQQEAAYLPKLVEALSVIAQNVQEMKSQGGRQYSETVRTPEQEAIRSSLKITEADYRSYFKRMRAVGQKDATKENEEAFWQYLIAADFNKMDGTPITKQGLASSFIAWVRMRSKEARELAEKAKTEALAKSAAEEKEAAERAARENWNDMMLRSEKNVNWDDE